MCSIEEQISSNGAQNTFKHPIHVTSEIGTLKTVLLKCPGREVENLVPEYLQRLLFDDIPFLPIIQREHDYFAEILKKRGIEILYLDKLVVETLSNLELKKQFIDDILIESRVNVNGTFNILREYLLSFPTAEMVEKIMSGILKRDIKASKKTHLYEFMDDHYPFYLDPMPNLYFTRDPAASIGNGISINRMCEPARRRESLFIKYIIQYHPRFTVHNVPVWLDRDFEFPIEGGDELILSDEVIAIGVSSRTSASAIEKLSINLFKNNTSFKKVLAVEIPKCRAFMHLDTVFTMVDYDKFTIHPAILSPQGNMNVYILEKGNDEDHVTISHCSNLQQALKEALQLNNLVLIPCGGGDEIASSREQWNDGSNTLAIAPGVVVTYDRNYISNELFRQNGITVVEILSSELSRGRGGPRCMSMPIVRENI